MAKPTIEQLNRHRHLPLRVAAEALQVSVPTLSRLYKAADVERTYKPQTHKDWLLRYVAEHPDASQAEIARALGVTRQRVHQLFAKWGVGRRENRIN